MEKILRSLAVVVLAVVAGPRAACAQETAADLLEPVVDRAVYASFCSRLRLADDQAVIADMLFDDYENALDDAVREADARADGVGRQTLLAAIAGRTRVSTEELGRLRAAVLGEYRTCIDEAFDQCRVLLSSTRQLLVDDQVGRADAAERWLRRRVMLDPRAERGTSTEYAGDGVDVLLLVDEATRPGGELAGIPADRLAETLTDYELAMDAVLEQIAQADLLGRIDRRIDRIRGDAGALATNQAAALDRWRRIHELNRVTAASIADLAAATEAPMARQRWFERFDEAAFPWLFTPQRPDRQLAWVDSRGSLDATRRAAIRTTYADYLERRRELAREAIDLVMQARLQHGVMLHPLVDVREVGDRGPRDLYQQLLRNSGERSRVVSTASTEIEQQLTSEERAAMRATIRGKR